MSNPAKFLSSIGNAVHTLAAEIERFKWEINPEFIEENFVHIVLEESKAKALTDLLTHNKVDETAKTALLKTLSKTEKKIALIHETIEYIISGSDSVDPRIEKLRAKINPHKEL